MIQRIQTIYLFLAAILMAMTLLMPLATFVYDGHESVLSAFGITAATGNYTAPIFYCLTALLILPTLLPVVIIFLYKKRLLQIRLCVSEIILLLGSLAFIGVFCWRFYDRIASLANTEVLFSLGWAAFMPIIAIILVILAIRGIAKDEALVRSLDRIR